MTKKIREFSFRELDKNYIFINNAMLAKAMGQFFTAENANGLLVYGYNDHMLGLGFEVLTTACLDAGKLKLGQGNDEAALQLNFNDLAEEEAIVLPINLPIWQQFAAKVSAVTEQHGVTEAVLSTRNVINLDACRSLAIPDVVTVNLVKGELVEAVLVRLEGIQKMFLEGALLQEPSSVFGIHEGERLSFYNVKNEQGIMCLAVFPEN